MTDSDDAIIDGGRIVRFNLKREKMISIDKLACLTKTLRLKSLINQHVDNVIVERTLFLVVPVSKDNALFTTNINRYMD